DARRFAARFEIRVEGLHARAVPDGRNGRLIQANPYFLASPADVPRTAVGATVIVEGRQPDQGRDGLPVVPAQFGQMSDEGTGDLGPDARDGLQNLVACLKGRRAFDDAVHALFQIQNLVFEVA